MVLWVLGRELGVRDREMLRVYYGAPTMREALRFGRQVALYTFVFEAAGAVVLAFAFAADGEPMGSAAWWGVFHSISAFNNAGFNVTGADIVPHAGNPVLLSAIIVLVLAGSLGFIPVVTLMRRRSWQRLPLDSKLVFATSGALLVAGALFIGVVEWRNGDTFEDSPVEERWLVSVFHSTNARSSGFATVDMNAMEEESKVALMGLMFVGGAAGSTAGGLKVGAFALLLAVMIATISGREEPTAFRRQLPRMLVQQATTLALYHVGLVFGFTLALTLVSDEEFIDVMFEAVSALGTVGYSTAGTASLGATAHAILIAAMLLGRFSPLLLVLHMSRARKRTPYQYPTDTVRLS
jgi:trk system potassium uptake protein TrkH